MKRTASNGLVDLHAHTTFSDGLFAPEELVLRAKGLGLAAVGVTDHDSVNGIEPAIAAAKDQGIEVVPGVEMSCNVNGVDVHILGYYVDLRSGVVLEFLEQVRQHREKRARSMVERLVGLGVEVTMAQVEAAAKGAAVGRPHVAQAMVESGAVRSVEEAFGRYIGYDGPAYVPKMKLSPKEAVDFIKGNGGIAVIAHPGTYHRDDAVYAAIAAGVDGIEVWHPDHGPREASHYSEIGLKNGLLLTGGSDCHGGRKNGRVYLGEVRIPYKYLAAVKRRTGCRGNGQ